ncbi:hypothetical protein [Streptomyces oceani]|uniref:hypothetical protein n=1 Tax=Streptomyces oceani TaxID=1075402 RepID=UPI001112ECF0|nr:hypothetical protein [Streptomyces oceani]
MQRPGEGSWGQPPPPPAPQAAGQRPEAPGTPPRQPPYGASQPYGPAQPYGYGAHPPRWEQQRAGRQSPIGGQRLTDTRLWSVVGRGRGARGALLGLGLLAAGVLVAIVLCLLPPHWTALRVLGFLLGVAGGCAFVGYANNGRKPLSAGIGLLFSCLFLGAALYTFEDTMLAATGVRGECDVVASEKSRTKGGTYQYTYEVECPEGVDSTLRGQYSPPPDSRTVTVVYQPAGLIEPQAPGDVSPALSLVGATLSGLACVGWALAGLPRRTPSGPYARPIR